MIRKPLIAIVLLLSTLLNSCVLLPIPTDDASLSYEPWVDLSEHYDLSKVSEWDDEIEDEESYILTFNTSELTRGKEIFSRDRFDDREYNATVVGKNVNLRTEPKVSPYTIRAFVNTGDKLTVTRSIGYMNGKYWCYVYVNTGNSQGLEGYICSDFIVEQRQYEMISNYIITPNSDLNIKTPSKMLQAVADILIKLEADRRHPRLAIRLGESFEYGNHTIVTCTIGDIDSDVNSTLIAVIQFFNDNDDYVVLGVVPGYHVNYVEQMPDNSYDVYFE
jgi:hypothetical protein